MKVWVTRNKAKKGFLTSNIRIWKTKPKPSGSVYISKEFPVVFSMWNFETLFGFTPRKGSCKQYELNLTEIM
jgi:hypothetical protein